MKHPTLYKLGKGGAICTWECYTGENGQWFVSAGQIDGKKKLTTKTSKPKNTGKSNATTAEEQAEKDAKNKWAKQLRRKYFLT